MHTFYNLLCRSAIGCANILSLYGPESLKLYKLSSGILNYLQSEEYVCEFQVNVIWGLHILLSGLF